MAMLGPTDNVSGVWVRSPSGEVFAVEIEAWHTVEMLKDRIMLRVGTPLGQQRLRLGGRELENQRSMLDYGLGTSCLLPLAATRGAVHVAKLIRDNHTVSLEVAEATRKQDPDSVAAKNASLGSEDSLEKLVEHNRSRSAFVRKLFSLDTAGPCFEAGNSVSTRAPEEGDPGYCSHNSSGISVSSSDGGNSSNGCSRNGSRMDLLSAPPTPMAHAHAVVVAAIPPAHSVRPHVGGITVCVKAASLTSEHRESQLEPAWVPSAPRQLRHSESCPAFAELAASPGATADSLAALTELNRRHTMRLRRRLLESRIEEAQWRAAYC